MPVIKFASDKHAPTIKKIAQRYVEMCREHDIDEPMRTDVEMTVSAVFAQGQVDLDLDRLLAFPDFDFAHDIAGMLAHIDRETGRLTRCFLPRAAR